MIVLTATHSSSLSAEMVGRWSAGSSDRIGWQVGAAHVEHQADAALRFDRRLEQQRDVLKLGPLRLVGERRLVGDELSVRFHDRIENRQSIGTQRRSGFGGLDDGVGEHRRLDLGRAPGELDLDVHALLLEVVLRHPDELGGDRSCRPRSCGRLDRRVFRRGQHPADLAEALFRVDEIGDRLEHTGLAVAELVFLDPVLAGQTGIEHAVGHVPRHLLRADEHALDLGIVDRREVGARVDVDVEAGAAEQLDGRLLQRALGDAEFEFHGRSSVAPSAGTVAVETRALAGVADVAVAEALHFEQHRIVVAVDEHGSRPAGGCPRFRPSSTAVLRLRLKNVAKPGLLRQRPGFVVHEADHQHFVALGVLNDRRNQSVQLRKVHHPAPKTKNPAAWRGCIARQRQGRSLRPSLLAQLRPAAGAAVMVMMRVVVTNEHES